MMAASGYPKRRATNAGTMKFRSRKEITTLNGSILASEIWCLVISHREAQKRCAMKAMASAKRVLLYIWILLMPSKNGEQNISRRNTGTCLICITELRAKNPYETPMRIYPAAHYPMGGLWVDYNLMSTIPGLHVLGEANFSDHGANRLGASALMQTLGDGYFIIPATIGNYLASTELPKVTKDHPAFKEVGAEVDARIRKLLSIEGKKSVKQFHRDFGRVLWEHVGISRHEAGLKQALVEISKLRSEFWENVIIPGSGETLNKNLEFAGRVADYLELGELMARDALHRQESCGVHFREESQTKEGETKRDDEKYSYVAAWEYAYEDRDPILHKEPLTFENVELTQRSYR